jgi:DNA-binding transcriptional LysR family regulator
MSGLSLRHLQAFVEVADLRHFGRTAERLDMAQPLLSQMILRLEQKVGGQLLLRRPVVQLTPMGEVFLPYAKRALAEVDTGVEAANKSASGVLGHLNLGFPTLLSLSWLPEAIADYHQAVPLVQIAYSDLTTSAQLDALRSGGIDVGFIRQEQSEVHGLCVLPIDTEPLVLVLPSNHPLSERSLIGVADLAAEPFILFPRNTAPRLFDLIMAKAREGGLELGLSREGRDWQMPGMEIATTLSIAWREMTDNPAVGPFIERLKAFASARQKGDAASS